MKPNLSAVLTLSVFAFGACSTPLEYREFYVGQRSFQEAWMAFDQVAKADGYLAGAGTDRGLRIYESRWRELPLPFRRGGRKRVRAEFESDDERGWLIRYCVQQQIVEDMEFRLRPLEEHWSDAGQDTTTEQRFAKKLSYRFGTAVEKEDNPSR